MRGCERRRYGDRGFVTAEAALALPVLVMVTVLLVSGLIAVLLQIQCVDAARAGARAAARQDPADQVVEVARGIAPRGAAVTVSREEGRVRVVVVARTPLPFDLRAEAVADAEEVVGTRTPPTAAERGAGPRSPVGTEGPTAVTGATKAVPTANARAGA